jgi:hypothetical protein
MKAAGTFNGLPRELHTPQHGDDILREQERGVPQDFILAYMWFNLAAAAQGGPTAAQMRDILEKKMTPAQIAEAQKLSREWKPTK